MTEAKRYVAYETTIGDLAKIQQGDDPEANVKQDQWGKVTLKEWSFPRVGLSELQQERQAQNRYLVHRKNSLDCVRCDIEDLVTTKLLEIVKNKYRGDLAQKIKEEAYKTKVETTVTLYPAFAEDDYEYVNVRIDTNIADVSNAGTRNANFDVSYDMAEMNEMLKRAKVPLGVRNDRRHVYIEDLSVVVSIYGKTTYDGRHTIARLIDETIKRKIKQRLTYCLRGGKLVVPDEYLERGEKGIVAWQELQRNRNAKNNMERRLFRKLIREKKDYLRDCIDTVQRTIEVNAGCDWTTPTLKVDGRWNNGKCKKLVGVLLKGKTERDLFGMSDEDLLNLAKEYWKDKLMRAYNELDTIKRKA